VFKKEVRDHLRDRRALLLALIYPLLGPALVAGGLTLAGKTLQGNEGQRPLSVPAVGLEFAPALGAYLLEHNITPVPAPKTKDAREAAVRSSRLPLVLVVPETAKGKQEFSVDIVTNLGRVDNLRATARLMGVIQDYNDKLAAKRVKAVGLPENYAHAIIMNKINVARDANVAVFFYNMIPPLVIFMIFLGGVHMAIDTTVGERERGSLEPLLLAPVERWVLLLAKALAALVFTAITTVANLTAFKVFLELAASTSDTLAEPPGWLMFVAIFCLSLPLMAIAVALQMSVAVITRSMKEAQIYLGLLPLVPALPGMVLVFHPINPSDISVSVPVFGQMTLINQLVAEQLPSLTHVAVSAAVTLVGAGLIFLLAAKWFRREKMFVLG
jgi:sodium transport system permease protein